MAPHPVPEQNCAYVVRHIEVRLHIEFGAAPYGPSAIGAFEGLEADNVAVLAAAGLDNSVRAYVVQAHVEGVKADELAAAEDNSDGQSLYFDMQAVHERGLAAQNEAAQNDVDFDE